MKIFLRRFVFLLFVALCQAKIFKSVYEVGENLATKTNTAKSRLQSRFPFKCIHIGRYPDPYDCSSYYICEKIVQPYQHEDGSKECPLNSYHEEDIGCILATEKCTCPSGTFWAGPLTGCINDTKDMRECCSLQPDCVFGDGGDFGACSLSALGYKYSCRKSWTPTKKTPHIEMAITVERCAEGLLSGACSTEKPLKLTSLNPENYAVSPVCETISHKITRTTTDETEVTSMISVKFLAFSEDPDGSLLEKLEGEHSNCKKKPVSVNQIRDWHGFLTQHNNTPFIRPGCEAKSIWLTLLTSSITNPWAQVFAIITALCSIWYLFGR